MYLHVCGPSFAERSLYGKLSEDISVLLHKFNLKLGRRLAFLQQQLHSCEQDAERRRNGGDRFNPLRSAHFLWLTRYEESLVCLLASILPQRRRTPRSTLVRWQDGEA